MILFKPIAVATTLALAAGLAACGDEPEQVRPLALTAHVLSAKEMPGFSRVGTVVRQDLKAFARAHDKTTAEVSKTGLIAGATARFGWKDHAQAMSIAEEFPNHQGAATEATRLFRANSQPEPGATAKRLAVTGIPGAKAVMQSLEHEGRAVTTFELVFSDGPVTHELFALGLKKDLSVSDLRAAALSLYKRINGHPLPEN